MGSPLGQSLMALAYSQITSSKGSPYLKVKAQLKAGGIIYNPLAITRMAIEMDFVSTLATQMQIHMAIPHGDLMQYITPYQDDLEVMLTVSTASADGGIGDDILALTRTYRAHLEDQTRSPMEAGSSRGLNDLQMQNLSQMTITAFRLEEVGVEMLRLIRVGTTLRNQVPANVVIALLSMYANSIELDDGEMIRGPSIDDGYLTDIRQSIAIPDNTPLLDVPDLIQNKEGGIYKEALGFFIANNHIHLWPLYKIDRQDTAKRTLRVYVSPDPKAKIPEQTWRIPDDSPDILEVWVGDKLKVEDNSQEIINQYGTGVRNFDPSSLLGDAVRAEGNRLFADSSKTTMSFQEMELVNGRNIINAHDPTTNPFKMTSMLAKAKGLKVHVVWHHSQPMAIVPGMMVEFVYDYLGEIRTVYGTLLHSFSLIDAVGNGINNLVSRSLTTLTLFLDRTDPEFSKWVQEGAVGKTPLPGRSAIT